MCNGLGASTVFGIDVGNAEPSEASIRNDKWPHEMASNYVYNQGRFCCAQRTVCPWL